MKISEQEAWVLKQKGHAVPRATFKVENKPLILPIGFFYLSINRDDGGRIIFSQLVSSDAP